MIWLYIAVGIGVAIVVTCLYLNGKYNDGYGDLGLLLFMVGMVGGMAAAICLIFVIAVPISRGYDERNCGRYERQTGRDTRFVTYGDFAWSCLTPANDGKWIDVNQLRDLAND